MRPQILIADDASRQSVKVAGHVCAIWTVGATLVVARAGRGQASPLHTHHDMHLMCPATKNRNDVALDVFAI